MSSGLHGFLKALKENQFLLFWASDCPRSLTPGPEKCVLVAKSSLTPCDATDYSLPNSSVHGILQVRLLQWVAFPSPGESSQPRDQTSVSCIAGKFFTIWTTRPCLSSNDVMESTTHCTTLTMSLLTSTSILKDSWWLQWTPLCSRDTPYFQVRCLATLIPSITFTFSPCNITDSQVSGMRMWTSSCPLQWIMDLN